MLSIHLYAWATHKFSSYDKGISLLVSLLIDEKNTMDGLGRNPFSLAKEYNNKGQQYYLEVCFDEAVVEYTRAIEADPTFHIA